MFGDKFIILGVICILMLSILPIDTNCEKKCGEDFSENRAVSFTEMVEMRDGTKLATDIYLPDDYETSGTLGAILLRTPYNRLNYASTATNWANAGWGVVIQSFRGRFGSEGEFMMFKDAASDGYDTVEWIASQNWSMGKVATYGGSALGINQYFLASASPPHLRCQVIYFATPELYYYANYVGGELQKNITEGWLNGVNGSQWLPLVYENENFSGSFWGDISMSYGNKYQNVTVPALHVAGWYDCFCEGTLQGFMGYQYLGGSGAKNKQKLVIGPWTHGNRGRYQGELVYPSNAEDTITRPMMLDLLKQYVLEESSDFDSYPNITYYVMGDVDSPSAPGNYWEHSDVWPVTARYTPLYLRGGGYLSFEKPSENEGSSSYYYDPTDPTPTIGGNNLILPKGPYDLSSLDSRDDVLVFTSDVLTEPIKIVGPLVMKLYVSSDCPDTDFNVRLADVYPDGRAMYIAEGIIRMRFRNGFDHWEFMEPGVVYSVNVSLWSTAYVFNTGHRIRIYISSASYPRWLANPNTKDGIYKNSTYNIALNTVYHNSLYLSALLLPIPTNYLTIPQLRAPGYDEDGCFDIRWNITLGSIGYVIQIDSDPNFTNPMKIRVYGPLTSKYTISSLSSGTYYLRIRAFNYTAQSNWSYAVSVVVGNVNEIWSEISVIFMTIAFSVLYSLSSTMNGRKISSN